MVVRRQRTGGALVHLLCVGLLALLLCVRLQSPSFTANSASHQKPPEAADFANFRGVGHIYDVIGEYKLPKPVIMSPDSAADIWGNLGVNVRPLGDEKHIVAPQLPSQYRLFNEGDEASLMDMHGQPVGAAANPGIRVEHDFVTEVEERLIVAELQEMAAQYGYDFSEEETTAEKSWRITGRDEKKSGLPLAPWGWGTEFNKSKLPSGLAKVIDRIEQLPGYPLGPIRDVTVNIRSSIDYQMSPHIDPPGDGPNSFVLSLMSGAVVVFSPIQALRENMVRANDEVRFMRDSYTDEDIDCLVPQRAMYHFAGEARYVWTHAVRPPATRMGEDGLEAYDRWGTWKKVLRRRQDRAAIIFTFADPPVGAAAIDDDIKNTQPE